MEDKKRREGNSIMFGWQYIVLIKIKTPPLEATKV
jgi:hypothetical protein